MGDEAGRPRAGVAYGVAHELISISSTDGITSCVGDLWYPVCVSARSDMPKSAIAGTGGATDHPDATTASSVTVAPAAAASPRGVVQLVHGMVEHIGRYETFARFLVQRGYVVCGIDQLGHGRSVSNSCMLGVYDPSLGASQLIEDQHRVRLYVSERFKGLPYFIMGHSMGSFVTRCYLGRHGVGLAGAIVMGTAWQNGAILACGKALAASIAGMHGWNYRSRLLNQMGVGGYNKTFEGTGAQTGVEWLSSVPEHAQAYHDDPLCGWVFSVSGYKVLFDLLSEAQSQSSIKGIPTDLPVLVISGADDPVGNWGKGPEKVYRVLKGAGVADIKREIIEGSRHEPLGERNAPETQLLLARWLDSHLEVL